MIKRSRSAVSEPTMMIHHIKEIQWRFLAIIGMLIVGMAVGYVFYEPLFSFIKAPLNGPLHYTSPAGSFNFIIKICLLVGVIAALPVVAYNLIMFVQPALKKGLSRLRVYTATVLSLLLATAGAAFGFGVIIPLALRFFYKFQVDGLVALISADDYLKFVVNVVITFVLIFQLPLIISIIDHISPLSPKKLFKAEKHIIVGSIAVGVLVPFALDPMVQLLIASPIIILYNLSIGIVLLQRYMRTRLAKKHSATSPPAPSNEVSARQPLVSSQMAHGSSSAPVPRRQPGGSDTGVRGPQKHSAPLQGITTPIAKRPSRPRGLITDIRPIRSADTRTRDGRLVPPERPIRLEQQP